MRVLRVAVLGAGYMGSAVTFPLCENGVKVNLWGTWLDDGTLDACASGVHPKLKKRLRDGVSLFYSDQLARALDGVDAVFVAVTSEGFAPVFTRFLEVFEPRDSGRGVPILTLTKGLLRRDGDVKRISETAEELFVERFGRHPFAWASVGGPVKAVDLSLEVPTATVYGTRSGVAEKIAESFGAPYYRITTCPDVVGVELSSAFKNVYAIALGICDGVYRSWAPDSYHNVRSLVFTQAVKEMASIVVKAGGAKETVYGLAGVGDLHVTSSSGRNRRFGDLIGGGMTAVQAFDLMMGEGETAEGYAALEHGMQLVLRLLDAGDGSPIEKELPLLAKLHEIVYRGRPLMEAFEGFISTQGHRG